MARRVRKSSIVFAGKSHITPSHTLPPHYTTHSIYNPHTTPHYTPTHTNTCRADSPHDIAKRLRAFQLVINSEPFKAHYLFDRMKFPTLAAVYAVFLTTLLTLFMYRFPAGLPKHALEDFRMLERNVEFEPCKCGAINCTCGVLYVLSNSTPVIDMYKSAFARFGGRKPHSVLLPQAISSFRKHHHRSLYKVAVMIDDDNLLDAETRNMIDFIGYFDTSKQTKPWAEALIGMLKTPWTKTLYMDADTRICAPLDDVFELLDHVDVAAVPSRKNMIKLMTAANQSYEDALKYMQPSLRFWFLPYSSFYAYRCSKSAWKMLSRAKYLDDNSGLKHMDALAAAMHDQKTMSFYPLPAEYHWVNRTDEYPVFISGPVRSLHGISTDCHRINANLDIRLFDGDIAALLRPSATGVKYEWRRANGTGAGWSRYSKTL